MYKCYVAWAWYILTFIAIFIELRNIVSHMYTDIFMYVVNVFLSVAFFIDAWSFANDTNVKEKSPGVWFNIKIPFYQYRRSHWGDETILRLSHLHNEIFHTDNIASLYWIMALGRMPEFQLIRSLYTRLSTGSEPMSVYCEHFGEKDYVWMNLFNIKNLKTYFRSHIYHPIQHHVVNYNIIAILKAINMYVVLLSL